MAKLSAIIPSRDEKFLLPTIHGLFRNARGEFEVIAILDSDKWPEGWKEITDQYPNLHTIHNGRSLGMRASINRGVASAISRGAKFIMKSDGHCSFSEGFDEVLKAECEPNWVVVPRRGRLDPENWVATETHKPDIDYHYLSFPDNPSDWGGKGLNGKPWPERAVERKDILLDEEMSSQGSAWFMHASYFNELLLMDEISYGSFWNEFQEIGLKCWLSGGKVMVNKKARYLHLHKGTKYGRGYRLAESQLQQGASFTKNWIWNDAWLKQTLPFSWLIEHFWPVPSWPDNWEEILYATRKPRAVSVAGIGDTVPSVHDSKGDSQGLKIHSAYYGIGPYAGENVDVTEHLRNLAILNNDSLDIVVNNSTLTPNQNPFRGKKKHLEIRYSYDGGEVVKRRVEEKDWLIIGPVGQRVEGPRVEKVNSTDDELHRDGDKGTVVGENEFGSLVQWDDGVPAGRVPKDKIRLLDQQSPDLKIHAADPVILDASSHGITVEYPYEPRQREPVRLIPKPDFPPRSAAALNDYLIRRFSISPQRLRGPMPIELRDFHRNDLAQLFAELGFKRGAEIGVAEGNYSEVLLKANPDLRLLMIDPWHHYDGNPQGKSKEKHEYAYNEAKRKIQGYNKALLVEEYSMVAASRIKEQLDFVYIDGNHLFDYVMQDLIEWSKRVRSGGIVSGDDYYALDQKRWVGGGVVEAVQAYVNAHRISIWYIFQGHKSTDFMWVKP